MNGVVSESLASLGEWQDRESGKLKGQLAVMNGRITDILHELSKGGSVTRATESLLGLAVEAYAQAVRLESFQKASTMVSYHQREADKHE